MDQFEHATGDFNQFPSDFGQGMNFIDDIDTKFNIPSDSTLINSDPNAINDNQGGFFQNDLNSPPHVSQPPPNPTTTPPPAQPIDQTTLNQSLPASTSSTDKLVKLQERLDLIAKQLLQTQEENHRLRQEKEQSAQLQSEHEQLKEQTEMLQQYQQQLLDTNTQYAELYNRLYAEHATLQESMQELQHGAAISAISTSAQSGEKVENGENAVENPPTGDDSTQSALATQLTQERDQLNQQLQQYAQYISQQQEMLQTKDQEHAALTASLSAQLTDKQSQLDQQQAQLEENQASLDAKIAELSTMEDRAGSVIAEMQDKLDKQAIQIAQLESATPSSSLSSSTSESELDAIKRAVRDEAKVEFEKQLENVEFLQTLKPVVVYVESAISLATSPLLNQISTMTAQITALDEELARNQTELTQTRNSLNQAQICLTQKDAKIDELTIVQNTVQAQLEENAKQMALLSQLVAQKDVQLSTQSQQLSQQDTQLNTQSQQLGQQESRLAAQSQQLSQLEAQLASQDQPAYTQVLADLSRELELTKNQLIEKEVELEHINAQLLETDAKLAQLHNDRSQSQSQQPPQPPQQQQQQSAPHQSDSSSSTNSSQQPPPTQEEYDAVIDAYDQATAMYNALLAASQNVETAWKTRYTEVEAKMSSLEAQVSELAAKNATLQQQQQQQQEQQQQPRQEEQESTTALNNGVSSTPNNASDPTAPPTLAPEELTQLQDDYQALLEQAEAIREQYNSLLVYTTEQQTAFTEQQTAYQAQQEAFKALQEQVNELQSQQQQQQQQPEQPQTQSQPSQTQSPPNQHNESFAEYWTKLDADESLLTDNSNQHSQSTLNNQDASPAETHPNQHDPIFDFSSPNDIDFGAFGFAQNDLNNRQNPPNTQNHPMPSSSSSSSPSSSSSSSHPTTPSNDVGLNHQQPSAPPSMDLASPPDSASSTHLSINSQTGNLHTHPTPLHPLHIDVSLGAGSPPPRVATAMASATAPNAAHVASIEENIAASTDPPIYQTPHPQQPQQDHHQQPLSFSNHTVQPQQQQPQSSIFPPTPIPTALASATAPAAAHVAAIDANLESSTDPPEYKTPTTTPLPTALTSATAPIASQVASIEEKIAASTAPPTYQPTPAASQTTTPSTTSLPHFTSQPDAQTSDQSTTTVTEDDIPYLQSQITALLAEKTLLLDQNSQLTSTNASLSETNAQLDSDRAKLESEKATLVGDKTQWIDKKVKLEDQNNALQQDNAALLEERMQLQGENVVLQNDKSIYMGQCRELQNDKLALENQKDALVAELDAVKQQCNDMVVQSGEITNQYNQLLELYNQAVAIASSSSSSSTDRPNVDGQINTAETALTGGDVHSQELQQPQQQQLDPDENSTNDFFGEMAQADSQNDPFRAFSPPVESTSDPSTSLVNSNGDDAQTDDEKLALLQQLESYRDQYNQLLEQATAQQNQYQELFSQYEALHVQHQELQQQVQHQLENDQIATDEKDESIPIAQMTAEPIENIISAASAAATAATEDTSTASDYTNSNTNTEMQQLLEQAQSEREQLLSEIVSIQEQYQQLYTQATEQQGEYMKLQAVYQELADKVQNGQLGGSDVSQTHAADTVPSTSETAQETDTFHQLNTIDTINNTSGSDTLVFSAFDDNWGSSIQLGGEAPNQVDATAVNGTAAGPEFVDYASQYSELSTKYSIICQELETVNVQFAELHSQTDAVRTQYDDVVTQYNAVSELYNATVEQFNTLQEAYTVAQQQVAELQQSQEQEQQERQEQQQSATESPDSASQATIDSMNQHVTTLTAQLDELQQQLQTALIDKNDLSSQLDSLQLEKVSLESQLSQVQSHNTQLVQDLEGKVAELEAMNQQMATLVNSPQNAQNEHVSSEYVAQLVDQNAQQTLHVAQLEQQLEEYVAVVESITNQYNELLSQAEEQRSTLAQQIEQNETLSVNFQQREAELAQKLQELAQLQAQNTSNVAQISQLQQTVHELEQTSAQLKDFEEFKAKASGFELFQSQCAALASQLQVEQSKCVSLLEQLRQNDDKWTDVVKQEQTKCQELSQQLATLQSSEANITAQYDTLLTQYTDLITHHNDVVNVYESVKEQIETSNRGIESVQTEYNSLLEAYNDQKSQLEQAHALVVELQAQIMPERYLVKNAQNSNNNDDETPQQTSLLGSIDQSDVAMLLSPANMSQPSQVAQTTQTAPIVSAAPATFGANQIGQFNPAVKTVSQTAQAAQSTQMATDDSDSFMFDLFGADRNTGDDNDMFGDARGNNVEQQQPQFQPQAIAVSHPFSPQPHSTTSAPPSSATNPTLRVEFQQNAHSATVFVHSNKTQNQSVPSTRNNTTFGNTNASDNTDNNDTDSESVFAYFGDSFGTSAAPAVVESKPQPKQPLAQTQPQLQPQAQLQPPSAQVPHFQAPSFTVPSASPVSIANDQELTETKLALAKAQETAARLEDQLSTTSQRVSQLESDLAQMKAAQDVLEAEKSALEQSKTVLDDEKSTISTQLAEMKAEYDEVKASIAGYVDHIAQVTESYETLFEQATQQQEVYKMLLEQHEALQQSQTLPQHQANNNNNNADGDNNDSSRSHSNTATTINNDDAIDDFFGLDSQIGKTPTQTQAQAQNALEIDHTQQLAQMHELQQLLAAEQSEKLSIVDQYNTIYQQAIEQQQQYVELQETYTSLLEKYNQISLQLDADASTAAPTSTQSTPETEQTQQQQDSFDQKDDDFDFFGDNENTATAKVSVVEALLDAQVIDKAQIAQATGEERAENVDNVSLAAYNELRVQYDSAVDAYNQLGEHYTQLQEQLLQLSQQQSQNNDNGVQDPHQPIPSTNPTQYPSLLIPEAQVKLELQLTTLQEQLQTAYAQVAALEAEKATFSESKPEQQNGDQQQEQQEQQEQPEKGQKPIESISSSHVEIQRVSIPSDCIVVKSDEIGALQQRCVDLMGMLSQQQQYVAHFEQTYLASHSSTPHSVTVASSVAAVATSSQSQSETAANTSASQHSQLYLDTDSLKAAIIAQLLTQMHTKDCLGCVEYQNEIEQVQSTNVLTQATVAVEITTAFQQFISDTLDSYLARYAGELHHYQQCYLLELQQHGQVDPEQLTARLQAGPFEAESDISIIDPDTIDYAYFTSSFGFKPCEYTIIATRHVIDDFVKQFIATTNQQQVEYRENLDQLVAVADNFGNTLNPSHFCPCHPEMKDLWPQYAPETQFQAILEQINFTKFITFATPSTSSKTQPIMQSVQFDQKSTQGSQISSDHQEDRQISDEFGFNLFSDNNSGSDASTQAIAQSSSSQPPQLTHRQDPDDFLDEMFGVDAPPIPVINPAPAQQQEVQEPATQARSTQNIQATNTPTQSSQQIACQLDLPSSIVDPDLIQTISQYLSLELPQISPIDTSALPTTATTTTVTEQNGVDQEQYDQLLAQYNLAVDAYNQLTATTTQYAEELQKLQTNNQALVEKLPTLSSDAVVAGSDANKDNDGDTEQTGATNEMTEKVIQNVSVTIDQDVYNASLIELGIAKELVKRNSKLLAAVYRKYLNNVQTLCALPTIVHKVLDVSKTTGKIIPLVDESQQAHGAASRDNHTHDDYSADSDGVYENLRAQANQVQTAYVELVARLQREAQAKVIEEEEAKKRELERKRIEKEQREQQEKEAAAAAEKKSSGWFGKVLGSKKKGPKHDALAEGAYENEFKFDPATGRYIFEDNEGDDEGEDRDALPPSMGPSYACELIDFDSLPLHVSSGGNANRGQTRSGSGSNINVISTLKNANLSYETYDINVVSDALVKIMIDAQYISEIDEEAKHDVLLVLQLGGILPEKSTIYNMIYPSPPPLDEASYEQLDDEQKAAYVQSIQRLDNITNSAVFDAQCLSQLPLDQILTHIMSTSPSTPSITSGTTHIDEIITKLTTTHQFATPTHPTTSVPLTLVSLPSTSAQTSSTATRRSQPVSNPSTATVSPFSNQNAFPALKSARRYPKSDFADESAVDTSSQDDISSLLPGFTPSATPAQSDSNSMLGSVKTKPGQAGNNKKGQPNEIDLNSLYDDISSLTGEGSSESVVSTRNKRNPAAVQAQQPQSTKRLAAATFIPASTTEDSFDPFGDSQNTAQSAGQDDAQPAAGLTAIAQINASAAPNTTPQEYDQISAQLRAEIEQKDAIIGQLNESLTQYTEQYQLVQSSLDQYTSQYNSVVEQYNALLAQEPNVDENQLQQTSETAGENVILQEQIHTLTAEADTLKTTIKEHEKVLTAQQSTIEQYVQRVGQLEGEVYNNILQQLAQSNESLGVYCQTNSIDASTEEAMVALREETIPGRMNALQTQLGSVSIELLSSQQSVMTIQQEKSTAEQQYNAALEYINQTTTLYQKQNEQLSEYCIQIQALEQKCAQLESSSSSSSSQGQTPSTDTDTHPMPTAQPNNTNVEALRHQYQAAMLENQTLQQQLTTMQESLHQLQSLQQQHASGLTRQKQPENPVPREADLFSPASSAGYDETGATMSNRRPGQPFSNQHNQQQSYYARKGLKPQRFDLDNPQDNTSDEELYDHDGNYVLTSSHATSSHNGGGSGSVGSNGQVRKPKRNNKQLIELASHLASNYNDQQEQQHHADDKSTILALQSSIPMLQDSISELLERCQLAEQQLSLLQSQGIDIAEILTNCGYNPATGTFFDENGMPVGPNSPDNGTGLITFDENGNKVVNPSLTHAMQIYNNGKNQQKGYALVPLHNKNELNVVIACSKLFLTTFAGVLASVVGASVVVQGGL